LRVVVGEFRRRVVRGHRFGGVTQPPQVGLRRGQVVVAVEPAVARREKTPPESAQRDVPDVQGCGLWLMVSCRWVTS